MSRVVKFGLAEVPVEVCSRSVSDFLIGSELECFALNVDVEFVLARLSLGCGIFLVSRIAHFALAMSASDLAKFGLTQEACVVRL